MVYCENCGRKLENNMRFCPNCGRENAGISGSPKKRTSHPEQVLDSSEPKTNSLDKSDEARDIASNKVFAVLSYFGPMILIPIFMGRDSRFARFHINQGLLMIISLFAIAAVISILSEIFLSVSIWLYSLIILLWIAWWIALVTMMIIGLVNAAGGRMKQLPGIGRLRLLK